MTKIYWNKIFIKDFLDLYVGVNETDNAIVRIIMGQMEEERLHFKKTPLQKEVEEQIHLYFRKELKNFELPIRFMEGTPLQHKIWETLQNIPYGEVISYKQLAERIGLKKGFRAIGNANSKNPIPIIVPCHRVVNHNHGLGGYAPGVKYKIKLLQLEGVPVWDNKIQKKLYHLF